MRLADVADSDFKMRQAVNQSRMSPRSEAFLALLTQRLVILDGAMGTMIQRHRLGEAEFRGARFAQWRSDLRGNNDLLSITQPADHRDIHREYLLAGADVISTNTFNSTPVSQGDYRMEGLVGELNLEAARLRGAWRTRVGAETGRPRFVAGALARPAAPHPCLPTSMIPDSATSPSMSWWTAIPRRCVLWSKAASISF